MNEQTRETRETRVGRDVVIGRVVGQSASYGPGGYAIGIVDVGESARQEQGGPLVDGPWGYVFGLASVIDNAGGTGREHDDARDAGRWLDEVADGDVLVVDERRYRVDVGRLGRVRLTAIQVEYELETYVAPNERETSTSDDDDDDETRVETPTIAARRDPRESVARYSSNCVRCRYSRPGSPGDHRDHVELRATSERGSASALVVATLVAVLGLASLASSVVDLSDEREDREPVRIELSRERERDAHEVDEYVDERESIYLPEGSRPATSSEPRIVAPNCDAEDDFGAGLVLVSYERERIVLRCLPH